MTCDLCDGRHMVARATTKRRPYHYVLSGLSNVDLIGIEVYRCPGCKVEAPIIPRIAELHRQMAWWLIASERCLVGAELRYLRKFGGLSQKTLSNLLLVGSGVVEQAERGYALAPPTERLWRLLCVMARGGESWGTLFELVTESRIPGLSTVSAVFEPHAKTWRRV